MSILEKMGIFGWKEEDENLLLASILTGDPLLLIGRHGSAKTAVAEKMAEALEKKFIVYDASKALFEDVLGYPNIKKLQEGKVEYIPSNVTIWDKEFALIDEINRALPEMQNKWLEIIRSRRIMGFKTDVKWVWAAMNPLSYSATEPLDEALVGRFSLFVYPPDVLSMNEEDRVKVAGHMNNDDAPGLSVWAEKIDTRVRCVDDLSGVAGELVNLLESAAKKFILLREEMTSIGTFLARFADLLSRETKGELQLDGRRLGFIYRNILATRAIEMAKAGTRGLSLRDARESARCAVSSSIPSGINEEGATREETAHKIELVFDLLSEFFREGSEIARVNLVYELFTTGNLLRRAEILLKEDLSTLVKTKAWNDLTHDEQDITVLAYMALSLEARRPGTIPKEMIDGLGKRIDVNGLSSKCVEALKGESIEYIDEVESLLNSEDDLEKVIAISKVKELVEDEHLTPSKIEEAKEEIRKTMRLFGSLLDKEGGSQDEGIQSISRS